MSRRSVIGLAWIAFVALCGCSGFGITGLLVGAGLGLVSLPASYNPAIIWKEHQAGWHDGGLAPDCYGDQPPNYGLQAEYDCHRCPFNSHCYVETMRKVDPR